LKKGRKRDKKKREKKVANAPSGPECKKEGRGGKGGASHAPIALLQQNSTNKGEKRRGVTARSSGKNIEKGGKKGGRGLDRWS